jgi:methionine sulfoxide reductase heme-binding subunit
MASNEIANRRGNPRHDHPMLRFLLVVAGLTSLFCIFYIIYVVLASAGLIRPLAGFIQWLFSLDSTQIWWYVTRASGLMAYFLLWLSTAWGLAVSSKIFDPLLQRDYTYDFHQYLSLFSLGFTFLHVIVLLLDHYLPFSIAQVIIPFTSTYRRFWVGLGVISLYIILLVTVTFYLRKQIGMRAFRWIHVLSLVGYLGVTLHALYAGTDSPLSMAQLIYKGSFLSVVFLTVFWLINLALRKQRKPAQKTITSNFRG